MENNKNLDSKNLNELKFENELLKLKMIAESGAKFSDTQLPPELENDWLQYILAFEGASRDKQLIRIYDKIGQPEFPLQVSDELLILHLEKLLDHLKKFQIGVETLCEVSPRELYRFIVEDLFEEQIIDLKFETGFLVFIYEDFYPNHPYDISLRIEEFLESISEKNESYYSWGFAKEFTSINGSEMKDEEVKQHLFGFFKLHSKLSIENFLLKELEIQEDKAIQRLSLRLKGTSNINGSALTYAGEGYINLNNEYGRWGISGINIPGLRI